MTWSVRRVSTLVQTFVRSAEQLTDTQLHSDIAPGGAFVRYEGSPQVQLLADSFFVGVQGVAEAYVYRHRLNGEQQREKQSGRYDASFCYH